MTLRMTANARTNILLPIVLQRATHSQVSKTPRNQHLLQADLIIKLILEYETYLDLLMALFSFFSSCFILPMAALYLAAVSL